MVYTGSPTKGFERFTEVARNAARTLQKVEKKLQKTTKLQSLNSFHARVSKSRKTFWRDMTARAVPCEPNLPETLINPADYALQIIKSLEHNLTESLLMSSQILKFYNFDIF